MADVNKQISILIKATDQSSKVLNKINANLAKMNKQAMITNKGMSKLSKDMKTNLDKTGRSSDKMFKNFKNGSLVANRTFRMLALSMMVGGYAIYRVFGGIASAAIDSFQKITATNGFMNTNINILAASWEYLKYTIGSVLNSALGPLMPMIINIVNKIADWIQQHPTLTAVIFATAIALGLLGIVLGTVGYIITGFTAALGGAGGLASVLKGFSWGGFISGLLTVFGAVIAVIGVVYVLRGFFDAFSSSTDQTSNKTVTLASALMGLAHVLNFVFNLAYAGGLYIGTAVRVILDSMWAFVGAFVVGLRTVFMAAYSSIKFIVDLIIDGLNLAISGANKLGANIKKIPPMPNLTDSFLKSTEQDLSKIKELYGDVGDAKENLMNRLGPMGNLTDLWNNTAISTGGTTSNQQTGSNPSLGKAGGTNSPAANINLNISNDFTGVGKDTTAMISESINKMANQLNTTIKNQLT